MLYCVVKWAKSPEPTTYRYSFYRYDPEVNQFVSVQNHRLKIGQVLCNIGGCDLNLWHYVTHTIINNFDITSYQYKDEDNKQNLIVIDYLGQRNVRTAHNEECSLANQKFEYEFDSCEFQTIYSLLLLEKAKLEKDFGEGMEAYEGAANQYKVVANLAGRMRRDMDSWLRNDPQHPYSQWRIAELRDYITHNINFFEYHKKENEND